MKWKFEKEFRLDKPETIGETDRRFDLDNYKDWLEFQLAEARKQLSLFAVSGSFTAADMEEAYNDGAGINKPREFDIENYH